MVAKQNKGAIFLNKNDNAREGKLVEHGCKTMHAGDLNKNGRSNYSRGNYSFMHAWLHNFAWPGGDLNENEKLEEWNLFILAFGIEGLK